MQEIGNIHLNLKNVEAAREAFEEELEVAANQKNQFRLLEVDALLGLGRCEIAQGGGVGARSYIKRAIARIQECGFNLRRSVAEGLLKQS